MIKKSKSILYLMLTVVLIGLMVFTVVCGWGKGTKGSAKNIKLGLELAGGVSITYQAKEKNPSKTDMADTIYKLQKRVEQYSTEASVYQESSNRISIEIPGVTDANKVLEELGSPGELYFISQKGSDGSENYKVNEKTGEYELTEGKTIDSLKKDGSIVLTGKEVSSAKAETTEDDMKNKQNIVSLKFNKKGTKAFADATTTAAANGESIGIYYDSKFVSVPTVNEAITGGSAQISGGDMDKDMQVAKNLASYIRIGGLSLELEELRSNVVGAQLGEDAIKTSLQAGLIGLIIVFLLMIALYRLPGIASGIGLVIYTLLMLIILNAYDITLTLPGIAGIILGIGMAVDANVIIFARVKEEIGAGARIDNSLRSGFKKAFSAILDGNITTLIAAVVLYALGSGSVKGFAQTLGIGIIVSMFTALVMVRAIIYSLYTIGFKDKKFYGERKTPQTIDFVGKSKKFFATAACVVLCGLIVMGVHTAKKERPFNYSLEFVGGTSSTVSLSKDYSLKEIDKDIVPLVEKITKDANVQVQKVKNSKDIVIKTRTLSLKEREELEKVLGEKVGFNKKANPPVVTENISSTVSSEMRRDAVIAMSIAIICMLLYIFMRFKDIRFAFSAILALVHDVLIVVLFYAVTRLPVGNTFIACVLTILGYSINATIVIFDRVREELGSSPMIDLKKAVNKAVSKTLTRSIYTSLTTFIMISVLYILGVSSVKEFALPIMAGIVAGLFSSVCLSGPLWHTMQKTAALNKKAKR